MTSTMDRIAGFVTALRFDDLPDRAVEVAVDAITDAVGVGLAGSREPLATPLLSTISPTPASRGVPLLGTTRYAAPADAALYNGTVIHALDYDDLSHPAYAHPSAHLLPVLISLGGRAGVDGRDLITAYVAGLEVESRLGRCLNMGHYLHGWHTTGTFGTLASAAAAAMLLDLDATHTALAVGIAASSAAGLRANFGTMTKPLHAGLAARNAVLAGLLAEQGFTASPLALDGRYGFLDVYQAGERDDTVWDDLGATWEITGRYGLAIKPYPSCGATHPAIEAALTVREGIGRRAIERIQVGCNRFGPQILIYDDPHEGLQGKFSMQYCVAAALATGQVGLDTFGAATLHDPAVRDLLHRVEVSVAADSVVRDSSEFAASVTVTTDDGQTTEHTVPLAKGKPERWLDDAELRRKFVDCASRVLPRPRAEHGYALLQALPEHHRPATVLAAIAPEARAD